jgi:Animal haem peroxidase
MPTSPVNRLFAKVTEAIDRRWRWDRFPTPVSITLLKGIRDNLRAHNLFDTNDAASLPKLDPEPAPRYRVARTADGAYNDLSSPAMGMAGTRFGRNVPLEFTEPEDGSRLMTPNPRVVSRTLLARGPQMIPATTLNVLAAAWLQFETRDWFSHGTDSERPFQVPRPEGDEWPDDPILLPRTRRDPHANGEMPRTFVNTETHWWDASQIYGSSEQFQQAIRKPSLGPGKVAIDANGLIDVDPALLGSSGGVDGWWLGLELLHTLFMREHNAVCDMLHAAYPSWSDNQIFDKARLVVAALIAKIHTIEWTTAILAQPTLRIGMRANWFGIAEERVHTLFGRLSSSEVISGIPGSPTDHHTAPYSITEEFVAVYRMHPLVPDELELRSTADSDRREQLAFLDGAGLNSRPVLQRVGVSDLLYSLGTSHPGAVTLHNHPRFMQNFRRDDGMVIDLAAIDILRSRERGVPRYNEFRRLLHLPEVTSFEALTRDPKTAAELHGVYDSIEDVDLTVGLYAEPPPAGFGFSDTTFRIFILMASRRLKSDRFFTTDFTPEVYTPEGIAWIDANDMSSVLVRHYPALAPVLRTVRNAFAPWPVLEGASAPGREAGA